MSSDSQHDETDSSIEQPVDSTPQMPGLQDIDQLTARELYELSKTVKERNDKAEAEKLQEKKKRTMWKRIERGKGELAALEENLKDAR